MATDEELFPPTIALKDLRVKHPDYDPDNVLAKYDAMYDGGKKFRDGVEKFGFLDKRQLDSADGELARPRSNVQDPNAELNASYRFQGLSRWECKKKVARYTNYVAGMLDSFVQSVFKEEPEIIGEKTDHWSTLSTNADGNGRTLATILRGCLLDTLLYRRAYLSNFVPTVRAGNRAQQRAAGGLTPRLSWLSASDVDFWNGDDGALNWVRTFRQDAIQTKPFGNPDQTRMLWTYITAKNIIEYEITFDTAKPPTDETPIARGEIKPHGFESLPVVPIQISADLWAMKRLEDPALALFNRETAMTCLINDAAFQILTIATDQQPDKVPDVGLGALWVGLNGKAEMVGPQGAAFDAQYKDALLKKNNMYEVFQAMGVNALATQTQNARQSGDAKRMDKEPLYALLVTFGYGMQSGLRTSSSLQSRFIGETKEPAIKWDLRGLNDISLKEKFENLLYAQDVQGYSPTARRQQMQDAALSSCPDAPNDIKKQIIEECEEAELDPPQVVPVIPSEPAGPIAEGASQPDGKAA